MELLASPGGHGIFIFYQDPRGGGKDYDLDGGIGDGLDIPKVEG